LGHKNLETSAKYLYSNLQDDWHAVEVLSAVFGGRSEKIADGQREEGACVVIPMCKNS
jgi:hypothetical protein